VAIEVTGPDGTRWTVRRRWTPRWARIDVGGRFRLVRRHRTRQWTTEDEERPADGKDRRWWDVVDLPPGCDVDALAWLVGIVCVVLLLWFVVVPLLLVLFDVVVVVVLLALGTVARVLLRRPWRIEANARDGRRVERLVVGWRASSDAVAELAEDVRSGRAQDDRSNGSSASA